MFLKQLQTCKSLSHFVECFIVALVQVEAHTASLEPAVPLLTPPVLLSPSVECSVFREKKEVVNCIEAKEEDIIDDWHVKVLPSASLHSTTYCKGHVDEEGVDPSKSLPNNDSPEHALLWEWLPYV